MVRRGSLQYWHRRRAAKPLPRVRSAPQSSEVTISDIVAYKAGMTHLLITGDEGRFKNTEVSRACTILEVPRTEVYGIRMYSTDPSTLYKKAYTEIYNKQSAAKLGIKNVKATEDKLESLKSDQKISDISLLIAVYPGETSHVQNHPSRYEARLSGKGVKEKLEFAVKVLGQELKPGSVFKNGQYVDVFAVSKGKGWQGPVKRFGISRNLHKATGKSRHVGTLGPMGLAEVLYTVPRAGQMGYHYRFDHNKRLLKIGAKEDTDSINVNGGFKNYGVVRGDYLIIDGSVPGPAKRMVRVRQSLSYINSTPKEPKITYISK
jgi:large subunit ribosomal protein L3